MPEPTPLREQIHFATEKGHKPIVLLPEGTCHNGHALLKFFTGAFEGGGPVQPVILRYPYRRVNAANFYASLGSHMLRLLLAPWVHMHVTYLPVYRPSEAEAAEPELYAENVRQTMSRAAGLPLSQYGA